MDTLVAGYQHVFFDNIRASNFFGSLKKSSRVPFVARMPEYN